MRLTSHLWTGATAPTEYVIFKVFYDRLGWTPQELRAQRISDVYSILAMVNVETRVENMRRKSRGKYTGNHPKAS